MIYSSRNGTLFYYDRVLYTWQVAEPTMLFLLGFEAITSYDNSLSDSLNIANCVYIEDQNDIAKFEYFNIYDKIHSYLSQLNTIEDFEHCLKFNCNGLKLFLNDLTGTGTDRTIPLIFRNDVNNKSIDLDSVISRLTSSSSATLYDRQAQKIVDIFSYADYLEKESIDITDIEDTFLKSYLRNRNKLLSEYYSERRENSQIYKLLDYKSMYSYALGVLYGCRCLGFSPLLIWRIDPKFWYNGEYENLVITAWYTFRFHHTVYISDIDDSSLSDKYKDIVPNRLWNFGSDQEIDFIDSLPLHVSEMNCYALRVDQLNGIPQWDPSSSEEVLLSEKSAAEPIIYSQYKSRNISVSDVIYSYKMYNESFEYYCFVITAIGESLPANSLYKFEFIITNPEDSSIDPIHIIKTSTSKDVCVFSVSDNVDDISLISYLERFMNNDSSVDISVTVTVGDNYTSDVIHLDSINDVTPQGEYLYISNNQSSLYWDNISNKVQDSPQKIGVVSASSTPIVRYFGDDKIIIHRAYKWLDSYSENISGNEVELRSAKYLSPNDDEVYFIATGNIGWSYFNENFYKYSDSKYPYKLSIVPYSDLPNDNYRLHVFPSKLSVDSDYIPIRYARYNVDNSIVSYYKCYLSDSNTDVDGIFIYGIFNGNVGITNITSDISDEPNNIQYDYTSLINYQNNLSAAGFFKEFISKDLFDSLYTDIELVTGCTLRTWYNISDPVSIFIKDGSGSTLMYTGLGDQSDPDDTDNYTLISNYGYTPSKSSSVSAYCYDSSFTDESTGLVIPKPYNLRYYNVTDKYWSNEDDSIWLEDNNRVWRESSQLGNNIYRLSGDSKLYRGQNIVYRLAKTYSLISNSDESYIFNDLSETTRSAPEGFLIIKPEDNDQAIESWWKYGFTSHLCQFILKDDSGHYLTDNGESNGNPLVWYDQETDLYWNGFANIMRWQKTKPLLNSQLAYITFNNEYVQIIDDPANETICLDGSNYISYSEFYSDDHNGIIRYKVRVFNPSVSDEIIDCLVDDKNDPDHPEDTIYCIPGVTTTWVHRSDISSFYSYRFVDGLSILYNGTDKLDVVFDDDDTD